MTARRLLILLVNTDPGRVEELGAPFYYAAIAAAMDFEVDVVCTAAAGRLMVKGVAETLVLKRGDPKTALDWIREAHDQGARFWACPANLDLIGHTSDDLIAECSGLMGAAAVVNDVMEGECRVLTF